MTREQRAALRRREREEDLQQVLSTASGRRLLWRIIEEWGDIHGLSADADPRVAAILEGRRAVGLALYQEAQRVAPSRHLEMVTEALQRQRDDAQLARVDEAAEE